MYSISVGCENLTKVIKNERVALGELLLVDLNVKSLVNYLGSLLVSSSARVLLSAQPAFYACGLIYIPSTTYCVSSCQKRTRKALDTHTNRYFSLQRTCLR